MSNAVIVPVSLGEGVQIANTFGAWTHGGSVTINGLNFGSKSPAAPSVWDPCTGSDITTLWTGAWPDSGMAAYRMQYRDAPYRDVSAPHGRTDRFMVGAHGDSAGFNAGYNVIVYKARTVSSFPAYTFASWYYRADPLWPSNIDNNKMYDWSVGTSPYTDDTPGDPTEGYWYSEYRPGEDLDSAPLWHVIDDGDSWDSSSDDWWGTGSGSNPKNSWVKVEHRLRHSQSAFGGLVHIRENGVETLNLVTRTELYSGTTRNDGIGGYANPSGQADAHRYFADLYLDTTWARVELGDNADYDACTNREMQIPTSWGSGEIVVTCNLGAFSSSTKYLFVSDDDDNRNAVGFPVTVGS